MTDTIIKNILENANISVNIAAKYNIYTGDINNSTPVENIKQAMKIIKNNNSGMSEEKIKNDVFSSHAITLASDKKTKKTVGSGFIKKPILDVKIKIFKNAGVGDLSSEYIFELDNIYVDREHRGVGLGEYIINRLILLRTGRGTTLYCQTNSEDISRVLKTNHRFENLKDNDDKPYLLGLM